MTKRPALFPTPIAVTLPAPIGARHLAGRCVLAGLFALAGFAPVSPAAAASLPYVESYGGADGLPWPAPWFPGSSHVTQWDLQQGRARLNGDPGNVARMILPGFSETDVEVQVTFEFEEVHAQGIGFYVRQNGGTLQEYLPHGQGYAMFLKGAWAWPEDLGLWREIDGVETQFAWGYNPVAGGLLNDTRYRLRFRVTQLDPATTLLQARVWPEASPEPVAWTIEATDTNPLLQGTAGSFAIDIYNHFGTNNIYIDDLIINQYPVPVGVPETPGGQGPPDAARLALSLPHPHPVSGAATFELELPAAATARLSVHDAAGRLVARPFDRWLSAGPTTLHWEPTDDQGRRLPSGVYFLRLEAAGQLTARRVVVVE